MQLSPNCIHDNLQKKDNLHYFIIFCHCRCTGHISIFITFHICGFPQVGISLKYLVLNIQFIMKILFLQHWWRMGSQRRRQSDIQGCQHSSQDHQASSCTCWDHPPDARRSPWKMGLSGIWWEINHFMNTLDLFWYSISLFYSCCHLIPCHIAWSEYISNFWLPYS